MTDDAIAAALRQAIGLERDARAHWHAAPTVDEQQAALEVVRHSTATIRSLEKLTAARMPTVART